MKPLRSNAIPSALTCALHAWALAALFVSVPVLDILWRNEEFFILHGAGPAEVIATAGVVGYAAPALYALVVAGFAFSRGTHFRRIHICLLVLPLACAPMLALKSSEALPLVIRLVASLALGGLGALLYFRRSEVRLFVSLLAIGALLYPLAFMADSRLLFVAPSQTGPEGEGVSEKPVDPVFLLIFDELSLASLLNEQAEIDAARFPNFARLAGDSTWFRNATTVAEATVLAVPSILTGRHPVAPDTLPSFQGYPRNAFTAFHRAGYEIYALESATRLCRDDQNQLESAASFEKLRAILKDVAVLSGHAFVREGEVTWLPSIRGRWAGFTRDVATKPFLDPVVRFDRFLQQVEGGGRFVAVHLMLPHVPYQFLPSGKKYTLSFDMPGWVGEKQDWAKDGHDAARAQQRYLLQLQFTDRLLGRFLARLSERGIYEASTIIVTADHGVSFRPGANRRYSTNRNAAAFPDADAARDILKVPALIKLPGDGPGRVMDVPFETIDILPTVAAHLGVALDWETDGRDVLGEPPELASYRLWSSQKRIPLSHHLDSLDPDYDFAHQSRVLDPARGFSPRMPPFDRLLGQPTDAYEGSPAEGVAVEVQGAGLARVDPDSDYLPARLTGSLRGIGPDSAAVLAVALNGRVEALTGAEAREGGGEKGDDGKDERRFAAMLPAASIRPGANRVELFLVEDPLGPKLRRISTGGRSSRGPRYQLSREGHALLTEDGPPIPLTDAFEGAVKQLAAVSANTLFVNGWAGNPETGVAAEQVVLLHAGRTIANSAVHLVSRHFGEEVRRVGLSHAGFELALERSALEGLTSLSELELYAIGPASAEGEHTASRIEIGRLHKWLEEHTRAGGVLEFQPR